jgi:hypothetical protein
MTDCSHRLAAGRGIRAQLDASHREWLAKRAQADGTRSSLLRLARSALELHVKGLTKGVLPRTDDGHSKPLLVALTALQTIERNTGV